MDIEMPILTGYEAMKELVSMFKLHRVDPRDRPYIIACTAHNAGSEQMHTIISGFDDYISKPIMRADFQKLLFDWFYNLNMPPSSNNQKQQQQQMQHFPTNLNL